MSRRTCFIVSFYGVLPLRPGPPSDVASSSSSVPYGSPPPVSLLPSVLSHPANHSRGSCSSQAARVCASPRPYLGSKREKSR
jgi:hypothetical protein